MARMRAAASAGYGASVGLNKFLDEFFRNQDEQKRQSTNNQNIMAREAATRADVNAQQDKEKVYAQVPGIANGTFKTAALSPFGRETLSKNFDLDKLAPSNADMTNKVVSGFSKATSLDALPTQEEAVAGLQDATNPIRPPSFLPSGQTDTSNQQEDVTNLIKTLTARNSREDMLQSNVPSTPIKQFDPTTGQETEHYVHNNQLAGVTAQLGRTDQGEANRGALAKTTEHDQLQTPARQAVDARGAGMKAGAEASAQAPYKDPMILYDKDEGNAHAFRFGPKGSQEVGLPPNMGGKTPPKPLTTSQVDQLASIGTAETEGVKILQTLKQLGLDKSNDPLDPRWNKFLVGTLGIAPADYAKADAQQRVAYVNAKVLSNLMKGRPSKYLAELYQQHTPQGTQTGEQLYHVLNNVLGQGVKTREELANYTGHKLPEPTSGMTYQQYQQFEQQNQGPSTPLESAKDKLQQLRGTHGSN